MRARIKELTDAIDTLRKERKDAVRHYIKENTNYLYITDHALVRYLERVENLLLIGDNDQSKLANAQIDLEAVRKRMLTKMEQIHILLNDKESFTRDGNVFFIIKGTTVVTVVKKKRRKHGRNTNNGDCACVQHTNHHVEDES